MPPPQEGLEAHARGLPLLGAIHTTFLPSKVCHLRPRRAVSAPGGVLGNLLDVNVSGRRARPERLAGLQSTRKVLSLCPLTMAYSWSGALGPRVVPRAAHAVNSCLSVLSGLGVARMGRLACVFRALLCWGRCARDWLQVWAACERICGCEQHKRLCFLALALAEQWRRAVSTRVASR